MSESGNVPVRESVGAALRFLRQNIQFVAMAALIGAGVATAFGALQLAVPQASMIASILSTIVQAFIYAALLGAVLTGPSSVASRVAGDGWRVFGAMAIVGFFMFLVTFVISIPVIIVLVIGPMSAYAPELQAAQGDETATLEVMLRFMEEQPLAILLTFLFYGAIWLALTSRLYLAAPASADLGRVLSFETWAWTKGQTLRIIAARLMLLLPAYVLVTAVTMLLGRLVGINLMAPETALAVAQANAPLYLGYVFAIGFVNVLLYTALEAGLSTYLYRGLRPPEAASLST